MIEGRRRNTYRSDGRGPHRLVEALQVLARLPMNGSPHAFQNSWPDYGHDFQDEVGWTLPDPHTGLAPDRPPLQMMKTRPSAIEITRMEQAIGWPAHYLRDRRQLAAVQIVALARSRNRDLAWAARKLRCGAAHVRDLNRDGLDQIAAGLRRDWISLF